MSLSQEELEAVISVVEAGSFRAAATKLHKAQSAISYAIKNLEAKLKIKLFERHASGIELTNAGNIVYNKAKSISKINQEIFDFSEVVADGIETKIELIVSPVTPIQSLSYLLNSFSSKFPQTQIELSMTTHEEPFAVLLKKDLSFKQASQNSISISSGLYNSHPELEVIKWLEIEFIPVASPEHPASLDGIREEDLNLMTHLVVGGRSTVEKKNYLGEASHSHIWSVNDFLIKREMLANGLGWGHMPKPLINRELQEGILVKVAAKPSFMKSLYLGRRKSDFIGPASSYLWNIFLNLQENSQYTLPPDLLQY